MDRRNGWLINPEAKELAALLLDLATNPQQLSQAGAAAHTRAMTHFSAQRFQSKLLASLGIQA